MRDCVNAEVRDRLPELVHGLLEQGERSDVESHVAECPDCAAEAALIRRAAGVIALASPRMDAARIASALPVRGVSPPAARPLWSGSGMRIAAALLIAVAGFGALQYATRDRQGGDVARIDEPLPATGGERAIARPVSGPSAGGSYATAQVAGRTGLVLVGGIDALTLDQLEALVSGVDGLDAMPSADPEPLPFATNGAETDR
ncbi:MAG TPA: zf-HC2 domain-containing protein [Gemmatimonadaceae bacterium]